MQGGFLVEKRISKDQKDGSSPSDAKKPDSDTTAAHENSDIEADRGQDKPPGNRHLTDSPRNSPNLTRRRGKRSGMARRVPSTESEDVEYLTPDMVCAVTHHN